MKYVYILAENENLINKEIYNILAINNIEVLINVIYRNEKFSNIKNNTLSAIKQSSAVLVFCNNFTNNFVLELGIAIGLEKEIFIFSDYVNDIPYLLKDHSYINSEVNINNIVAKVLNTISNEKQFLIQNNKENILSVYEKNKNIISQIEGKQFEDLVYELLMKSHSDIRKEFYSNIGYDMLISYNKHDIIVEAKKLSKNSKVSINYIQQFFGILNAVKADYGLFVSNVEYTPSAFEFSNLLEGKIRIITFDELYNLLVKNKKGISELFNNSI